MVNIQIPEEQYNNWFVRLMEPFFQKLGLESILFYIHSSYLYTFLLLALIVVIVVAVIFLVRKKKNASTRIQEEEEISLPQEESTIAIAEPRILAAVHQHIGTREDQEDSYGVSDPSAYGEKGLVAVVADGMGGLSNGRMVSSALVRSILNGFANGDPRQNSEDLLLEQAVIANAGVNHMLQGQNRSGSTLVCGVIRNGFLHFLTVGDSRIYLYRGGALIQLNREHIYQEELAVKAVNQMNSLQQVRGDRQAHALTSYFGIGRLPAIDRNIEGIRLMNGDKLLLSSDGVFGTLTQAQLEAALAQDVNAAARTIGEQIAAANRAHQDNNTAVILEYRI